MLENYEILKASIKVRFPPRLHKKIRGGLLKALPGMLAGMTPACRQAGISQSVNNCGWSEDILQNREGLAP
jgi:hypothetical protein